MSQVDSSGVCSSESRRVSFREPASISGGMGAVGSGGANSGTTIGGSER